MNDVKRYWGNTPQYQRILEILEAYWLEEKDEFRVRVRMDFIKANGETQTKEIHWQNPHYTCETAAKKFEDCIIEMSDLMRMSDYELYKRGEEKFYHTGKIIKRQEESQNEAI